VALTFDEGPSTVTAPVLEALKTANVKATFHVVTPYLFGTNPLKFTLERAYKDGHLIGLRFPTSKNPLAMSDEGFKNTLRVESEEIFKAIKQYPRFLRLPSNQVDERLVKLAEEEGFVVSEWNIDTNDYSPTTTAASIIAQYQAPFTQAGSIRPGFISLHHDGESVTAYKDVATLASVIKMIQDNGYQLVTMDTCLGNHKLGKGKYREKNGNIGSKSNDAMSLSLSSMMTAMTGFLGAMFF
jgi:peptidoglycan/xylan/chitin deacetylase (PgdA/CDA1 family)